jgi:hypothetical protein
VMHAMAFCARSRISGRAYRIETLISCIMKSSSVMQYGAGLQKAAARVTKRSKIQRRKESGLTSIAPGRSSINDGAKESSTAMRAALPSKPAPTYAHHFGTRAVADTRWYEPVRACVLTHQLNDGSLPQHLDTAGQTDRLAGSVTAARDPQLRYSRRISDLRFC